MSEIIATNSISFILIFWGGVLSFFSPCVVPLIPVYMSYLAGNTKHISDSGTIIYERKQVIIHTLFFVLGISFAFFILGMSFTALGKFFNGNQLLFTRGGGILIVLLGLFQLGLFELKFLRRERKLKLNLTDRKMNPLMAFVMGFTFSFAWTPCVGPVLSAVLIMASGSSSSLLGNLLVMVYSLGFVIPFILLGLFTTQVLNFLKKHKSIVKYTVKIGGVILIIIGIMTFTGWMNSISRYLNTYVPQTVEYNRSQDSIAEQQENNETSAEKPSSDRDKKQPAADFSLKDQYGNVHTLSDYKGKVVFLNFWATWCPPCRKEMPDIESIYKEYGLNKEDIIILGVANPSSEEYPLNQDVSKEEIITFLEDYSLTFPTVFDETGDVFQNYYISAFPTTFMIDKDGNIFGYAPGMLTKDMMHSIIKQTLASTN